MPGPALQFQPRPGAPPLFANGIYIDGSRLVVPEGYIFPPICLGTGATTGLEPQTVQRVTAHPFWLYALLALGVIPYVLVALILSGRGTFSCRLTKRVLTRWRWIRMAGAPVIFASLCYFEIGASRSSLTMCGLALAALVLGIFILCGKFSGIRAEAVKEGNLWLTGIPKRVREQVVEIESRREEAVRKAAEAQQAASRAQAAV